MTNALLALVGLLSLSVAPGKGPPPQMPNMPGLSGANKGPPWRLTTEKVFNEACQMNRGQASVFCFPDVKEIIEGLVKAADQGADHTAEMFLLDLHVVIETLLSWPSAWPDVSRVLAPNFAWTKAYCDKIMGDSPIWFAAPLVRKSFISPRQTLAQVEKQNPHVAAAMNRWFEDLKKNGDGTSKELLKELKVMDAVDVKNRSMHARPMMRLMMHEHAKVLKHIFGKACKGSKSAWAKLERADQNGITAMHHLASLGDAAGLTALLRAAPKASRSKLATPKDKWGYTPEDYAKQADYPDVAAALQKYSGASVTGTMPPEEPVKLFRPADEECSADGSSSCPGRGPSDLGGWSPADLAAVPSDWLSSTDKCDVDTIDKSQFDFNVFAAHYMLHPRPLIVKGAGRPPSLEKWSRDGLIAAAGERKVSAELFPSAQAFDGSRPMKQSLREYLDFQRNRSSEALRKKLHYGYFSLDPDEHFLNFSSRLPEILEAKVEHTGTVFLVGGAMTGTPPQHHGPAANSLVYGSKMWFFDPPGRELTVQEPVYEYLVRTQGAPNSTRCLQEAGDLVFVPRSWTHAVLCLGDCIGASVQFTHQEYDLRD